MRNFRRCIAFVLALVTTIAIIPPLEVLANRQAPIPAGSLNLVDTSPAGGTTYNIQLNWLPPPVSSEPDTSGVVPGDVNALHPTAARPLFYDLEFRNATTGGTTFAPLTANPFGHPTGFYAGNMPATHTTPPISLNLPGNSVFAFRVVPWHMHEFDITLPDGTITQGTRRAQVTPNFWNVLPEILYLTDITPRAVGRDGEIHVDWPNPTYMGRDIFWGFEIMFRRQPLENQPPPPWTSIGQIPMAEFTRGIGGRLEYSFSRTDIGPGLHEVAVEPLILGPVSPVMLRQPGLAPEMLQVNVALAGAAPIMRPIRFPARTAREYSVGGVSLPPPLTVSMQGNDNILLTWPPVSRDEFPSIRRIEIFAAYTRDELDVDIVPWPPTPPIHTIHDGFNVQNFHVVPVPRPLRTLYFQYRIITDGGDPMTEEEFTPSEIEAFNPFLVEFAAYRPTIRPPIVDNADTTAPPLNMSIDFRAFTRVPYDMEVIPLEFRPEVGMYLDRHIMYDIWITDRLSNLSDPAFLGNPDTVVASPTGLALGEVHHLSDPMGPDGATALFYRFNATQFVRWEGGNPQLLPLEDNTVYYIRIIARRMQPSPEEGRISLPAYSSHYIPPIGPLWLRPQMMQAPPLRIALDEDGNEMIGVTDFTVEWQTSWAEVYDSESGRWYTLVANDGEGLIFGRAAAQPGLNTVRLYQPQFHFDNSADRERIRDEVAAALGVGREEVPIRMINLPPGTLYQVHVVGYDHMLSVADSYEDYMLFINDEGFLNWTTVPGIEPDDENPRFEVTTVHAPPGSVQPNTAYVVFLRPLVASELGTLVAWYPAYIAATTVDEHEPLIPIPTIPRLEFVEAGDTWITVRWNYSPELNYELRWHEQLHLLDGAGVFISADDIATNGDLGRTPDYIYYTVTGLFPNTVHFFEVRARVDVEGAASLFSEWSNAVDGRTLDLQPPPPPTGLGLISAGSLSSLNILNEDRDENFTSVGNIPLPDGEAIHYMIMEFRRINDDIYNPEPPDAPETDARLNPNNIDYEAEWASEWLQEALPQTYVAIFGSDFGGDTDPDRSLLPNRIYYFRARTVLTVTRRGALGEGIERAYSYRLQISHSPDFFNYLEIEIPALVPEIADEINALRRESAWTPYVRIRSGLYDGEYDGDVGPDQHPIPDRDWEWIPDFANRSLTFRFRNNQVGLDGLSDNLVDQRFISRLQQQRVFVYEIEFMPVFANWQVLSGVIEMPYSILLAFNEMQISLDVTFNNINVVFPPGSLVTQETRALSGMAPGAVARIYISNGFAAAPSLPEGITYISHPREIAASIITPFRTFNFDTFGEPLRLAFTPDNQALMREQNVGLFTAHRDTGGWQRVASERSLFTGELTMLAHRAGNFAGLAQSAAPQMMPTHMSRDSFLRVTSHVAVTDMNNFNPMEAVTGDVFNNLIAAVAMNRPSITARTPVSQNDRQTLTRARMYVGTEHVSREAAFAVLVTFYERSVGRTVQVNNPVDPPDMSSAHSANHQNILKARELGFFSGHARPREVLIMGDFMDMLALIVMDAR